MHTRIQAQSLKTVSVGVVGIVLFTLGCASRQPPAVLEEARRSYTRAQQDPQVTRSAPDDLSEAAQSLRRAERVWEDDQDVEEVEHLAYVIMRRVDLAQTITDKKAAEARLQQLNDERQQVLLEARTREAQQAQQQASLAQQSTEQARQQAAEATRRARQLEQDLASLQAQARETERGLILTLGDVLFALDSAILRPGITQKLYPLVTYMREHPARQVTIEGYTDSLGSETYNLDLSARRAQAVRDFLVQNGVPAAQIVTRGLGEAMPVASNSTETGRQMNRRVEIILAQ